MIRLLFLLILSFPVLLFAQQKKITLNTNWQFRQAGTKQWHKATVPGSVYTDLLNNKLMPDPFFSDNEKKLRWVDTVDWEYKTYFSIPEKAYNNETVFLNFEGLDTYADVYVNGHLLLKADNMFRPWGKNISDYAKAGKNELRIYFHSAKNMVDSIAKKYLPLVYPDNNRVFARKAQYQFGWDWGPIFIGCGVWKDVNLSYREFTRRTTSRRNSNVYPMAQLVQQKDSIGESFYFTQNGKPFFCKGANWIPSNIFLPTKPKDYRRLLTMAKDAGVNMLRVWGGGIYEDDEFYRLCDSLNIMVWQDFMFAGGMYPANEKFLDNVREEVKYQVTRLSKYKSVVLYCGNNEIDEAWHHWGWQGQYNLHGADSAKIWNEYVTLFRDSLKAWVKLYDGQRPYISTSPMYGWGNPKSYTSGDSHYWGFWWGLADWESFKDKTGRFVSEWGMQAMPNYETVKSYTGAHERTYNSAAVQWHQKANQGFLKLNHYINKYFFDTTKLSKLSLQEYTYLTQCIQYYLIKNVLAIHIAKQPRNMGTLIWQWNDCWPVTSWSVTDYSRQPKAGYYALKNAFTSMDTVTEKLYPKDLKLLNPKISITKLSNNSILISSEEDAKYVYLYIENGSLNLSDNYFDLKKGEKREIHFDSIFSEKGLANKIKSISLYNILSK